MSLFSAVSNEEMEAAQVVTGATMAAFITVGFVPGLRRHVAVIRGALVVLYLLACGVFVGYAMLR
jgi:hypothetical protein